MRDDEWCSMLPHVEFAINAAPAASTGIAPAQLVFGTRLQSPLDLLVDAPVVSPAADDLVK